MRITITMVTMVSMITPAATRTGGAGGGAIAKIKPNPHWAR